MKDTFTVILVDDDDDEHQFFREIFATLEKPVDFHSLYNGKELINHFSENKVIPDLLFMDINMPMINGFAALKHIKSLEQLQLFPVVIYSTSENPEDIKNAYALGADLYCIKIASMRTLSNRIKLILQIVREKKVLSKNIFDDYF
jgi:CheY-like chemotaxis protein